VENTLFHCFRADKVGSTEDLAKVGSGLFLVSRDIIHILFGSQIVKKQKYDLSIYSYEAENT